MNRRSDRFYKQHMQWRQPADVCAIWEEASRLDPALLDFRVTGDFVEILHQLRCTAVITREYEHLAICLAACEGRLRVSYFRMPHPSGVALDPKRGILHIASTRNPNVIYSFRPIAGHLDRLDMPFPKLGHGVLAPIQARFLPGCMYIHDLAIIDSELHVCSVGQNAIVKVDETGVCERIWWPACIEDSKGPVFGQNFLQLNGIAAGKRIQDSFFSASTDHMSRRRPGHENFAVDRRGVIFAGNSREVFVRGLTRPHSVRLNLGKLWVDNSGYGELGSIEANRYASFVKLPGWTRGLGFAGQYALVGTSRILPRFSHYAPGLDAEKSRCGVHLVDLKRAVVAGSLFWPNGDQIFAVEFLPADYAGGFPFTRKTSTKSLTQFFYSFGIPKLNQ